MIRNRWKKRQAAKAAVYKKKAAQRPSRGSDPTQGSEPTIPMADPKVAAIVDFYGITDVADLLDGPNKKAFPENWHYTVQWLGNQPNREAVAKAASPLTYVRAGLPPVISIHGDADPLVPYQHSVRLQDALQKAGVVDELVTIPGGGHGNFSVDQWQRAYAAVEKFLAANVPAPKASSSSGKP